MLYFRRSLKNIRGFRQRRTGFQPELKYGRAVSANQPKADLRGGPAYGWGCDMNYSIYILRSLKNNKRYIGYTGKNVDERFHEHLSGTNQWTRQNGPFILIHTESFVDKPSAIRRERFLKSGQDRKWIDENIRG